VICVLHIFFIKQALLNKFNSLKVKKSKNSNTILIHPPLNIAISYNNIIPNTHIIVSIPDSILCEYVLLVTITSYSFIPPFSSASIEWIIDFGASLHMSRDASLFSCLANIGDFDNKIYISDSNELAFIGSNSVVVDKNIGNDVYFMLKLSDKCNASSPQVGSHYY